MKLTNKFKVILVLLLPFKISFALSSNLWQTPDQQGSKLLSQGKAKQAATTFGNRHWQGVSQFKSAQYKKAIKTFSSLPKSDKSFYNLGNALAHTGAYEKAIAAYKKSLKLNPHDQDTLHNKKVLEDLLKKQKKQKEQDKKDQGKKDQDNKDQSKKDQDNKDQSKKDQDNKDQNKKDQGKKDQSKKDQDNKDQNKKDQNKKDQGKKDQSKKDQDNKDQSKKDQGKKDQGKKDQGKKDQDNKDQSKKDHNQPLKNDKNREKSEAQKQQLKRVPDNPGGLLKQKFMRDYIKRHPQQRWY